MFYYTKEGHQSYIIFLVVWQLNNLELAVNLVKRGNLPGAENLVNTLFSVNLLIFSSSSSSMRLIKLIFLVL